MADAKLSSMPVEAERDELLAALKDLVDHPELEWAEELATPREKSMKARALIARIEGKT